MDRLTVNNLYKNYDSIQAVSDVSFSIQPGEIFGLLGPNGAGKTTIISCVVGLEEPTAGEVKILGVDLKAEPLIAKKHLGFVPQEIINHGYFTVLEIVRFYSGYFGCVNNDERIHYLLKRLHLWDKRNTPVKRLSGGMKRRLLIAKALSHNPDLILLDEPTAGVDIELREDLWSLVREMRAEGKSVLLTTHYLEEAESLCDRVGVIHQGRLLMCGPTKELIKKLTYREVTFNLKHSRAEFQHPKLVSNKGDEILFRIPSSMVVGDLLSEVDWDMRNISDIAIKEGSLEDAFRSIVNEAR